MAEGLLDHDAGPWPALDGPHQPGRPQAGGDRAEGLRRRGEVEEDVAARVVAGGELLELGAHPLDLAPAVEGTLQVVRGPLQPLQDRRIDRRGAELAHRLGQALAHGLVRQRLRAESEDREAFAEKAVARQVVEDGRSLRRARSPLPPKTTSTQGGAGSTSPKSHPGTVMCGTPARGSAREIGFDEERVPGRATRPA